MADLVFRRTSIAIAGRLTLAVIEELAEITTGALDWTADMRMREIEDTVALALDRHGVRLLAHAVQRRYQDRCRDRGTGPRRIHVARFEILAEVGLAFTLSLNTNPLVNRFAEPEDLIETVATRLRIRDLQLTHEFINPSWPAPLIRSLTNRMSAAFAAPGSASPRA